MVCAGISGVAATDLQSDILRYLVFNLFAILRPHGQGRQVPAAQAGLAYAGFPHITVVRSTPKVPGLVPAYPAQSQAQREVPIWMVGGVVRQR